MARELTKSRDVLSRLLPRPPLLDFDSSLLRMPPKRNASYEVGATVHAAANRVLSNHSARTIFGRANIDKHFLQGTVANIFDGRAPGGKNTVWKLAVDFKLPPDDKFGSVELKRVDIHHQHCKPGLVSADLNPQSFIDFTDTIGDPDWAVRGSTTYIPNAEGRANAAADAAAAIATSKNANEDVPAINDEVDDATIETIIDNGLNAIVAPPAVPTATRKRRKTMRAATPKDKLTATLPLPPPPLPPTGPTTTKATKRKTPAAPIIDLHKMPMWVSTNDLTKHRVMAITHERKWVVGDDETITGDVADELSSNCQWSHKEPSGERIAQGNREYSNMSPLAAFLHMMPPKQLLLTLELTNKRLALKGKTLLTRQELLWWIGVCVLVASINFCGDRRKLWEGGGATSKFLPSYDLTKTKNLWNRWDDIRWSRPPAEQPEGMSSEQYRWMLVEDFVTNFNEYRSWSFDPGDHLEANKTIIRWYSFWGAFVDVGLLMYVAMDRKPDNGAEIQNLADVLSGIMLRLKIVKSAVEEKAIVDAAAAANVVEDIAGKDESGKGTRVLLELTEPWHNTSLSPPTCTLCPSRRH
jgi:hypothetical protein